MNDYDQSLNASFWLMIIIKTFVAVDPMPGTGPRKMPAPKAYVPAIITWGILQLAADAGYERPASTFGWLVILASIVLGETGSRLIALFKWIGQVYGNIGQPSTSATAPMGATPNSVI